MSVEAPPPPLATARADGPPPPRSRPPGRYGISELVASEWIKLTTVRSTVWTLAVTLVLGIGLGALATAETSAHWSTVGFANRVTFDPTRTSLTGILLAQLAIGVLGVLAISAEYGTGTIRATFAAAPRRSFVLAAKAIVFGLVALVVGEIVSFVAFFLGQSLLTGGPPHASIGEHGVLSAVVAGGLYLTVLGLIALGIATLLRHSAGAISTFVGILLILPLIVSALPSSIGGPIGRYLPANIGVAMVSTRATSGSFSTWTGFGVLCGYAAALLVLGGILLNRRDA